MEPIHITNFIKKNWNITTKTTDLAYIIPHIVN